MEDKSSYIDEWLDKYSLGIITDAELKKGMEEQGVTNYEELISMHKAAINIIQRRNVLQQVGDIHGKYAAAKADTIVQKSKAGIFSLNPLLRIAAVFLLIITSAAVFFISSASQKSLAGSLSEEYHVQISRSEDGQKISTIIRAFNGKDFTSVIKEFGKLSNPSAREMFLGGYAYLQAGDYATANSIFSKILDRNKNTGEKLYQDEAEYYLVLSLIQQKQYKEAYYFADKIHNDSYHTYHTNISSWFLLKLKWLE